MAENINLADNPPRIQYIADGIKTVYETPFPVFKEQSLKVYFDSQEISAENYTVELDNELRAVITFLEPPANQITVTIIRDLPIERTSNFQEASTLRSEVLNYEFNYLMACLQQITDALKRSMILPPYAVGTNHDLSLPEPEAGKAIVWTNDGLRLENSTVSVNALENTLHGYKIEAQNACATAAAKAQEASTSAMAACEKAAICENHAQAAVESATYAADILDEKANKGLDNLTSAGVEKLIEYGLPDYTRGVSVPVNATFIPSTNGYIEYKVYCSSSNGGRFFICEETSDGRTISGLINVASGYIHTAQQVKVLKNKVYYILSSNATVDYVNFYPMKGE